MKQINSDKIFMQSIGYKGADGWTPLLMVVGLICTRHRICCPVN